MSVASAPGMLHNGLCPSVRSGTAALMLQGSIEAAMKTLACRVCDACASTPRRTAMAQRIIHLPMILLLLVISQTSHAQNKTKINPKDSAEMVYIPAGEFTMGSNVGFNYEKPAHKVRLTKGYWMYRNDVTVEQYEKYCRKMGKQMPLAPHFNPGWKYKNHPIVKVSWNDAMEYCHWRSEEQ